MTKIECDQFIARPPAAVWRALTEPDQLAAWWAPGDIKPIVGHRFTMDMAEWGHQPCEVLEVERGAGPAQQVAGEIRVRPGRLPVAAVQPGELPAGGALAESRGGRLDRLAVLLPAAHTPTLARPPVRPPPL